MVEADDSVRIYDHDPRIATFYDYFLIGNITQGVQTIGKLMALTYHAQFEDLNGRLAEDPVFPLNFRVDS